MNGFAVTEIILGIDAVNENDAGLGIIIGRLHDLVPQAAGRNRAVILPGKAQGPGAVCLHRGHEGIAHQHGQIEIAEPQRIALGGNESFDIGMVAAHGGHHGAAPRACRHDGAAHGVPHIHEAQGSRGISAHAFDRRALGPER